MFDRRDFLALSAAGGFVACAPKSAARGPGQGWVVAQGATVIASDVSGFAQIESRRSFSTDSPFRIASITKLAVSMMIHDLAAEGLIDLGTHIGPILPLAPQNVTLQHLLSHTSGLRDPDIYWASALDDIRDLFSQEDFTHPPGTYFRYANLNYGLAASVVEAQLNERFDQIMSRWLETQNIDAGLNWAGVSTEARAKAAALYRKEAGHWSATVDTADTIPTQGGTYLGHETLSLSTYRPGKNGTLFSPQGGLRTSLLGLIGLGAHLQMRPVFHRPIWTYDGTNGDDEDAHFLAFGPGSYIYTADISPLPGIPLVGHLGWAYGAHTGLFIVPGTDITFAFARLGSDADDATMTGGRANQFTAHQARFDALAPTVRALI